MWPVGWQPLAVDARWDGHSRAIVLSTIDVEHAVIDLERARCLEQSNENASEIQCIIDAAVSMSNEAHAEVLQHGGNVLASIEFIEARKGRAYVEPGAEMQSTHVHHGALHIAIEQARQLLEEEGLHVPRSIGRYCPESISNLERNQHVVCGTLLSSITSIVNLDQQLVRHEPSLEHLQHIEQCRCYSYLMLLNAREFGAEATQHRLLGRSHERSKLRHDLLALEIEQHCRELDDLVRVRRVRLCITRAFKVNHHEERESLLLVSHVLVVRKMKKRRMMHSSTSDNPTDEMMVQSLLMMSRIQHKEQCTTT